ncbi:MAG: hypothetical protein ACTSUR_00695 [Candidatus Heimdallarchaeaceae archaeon]
MSKTEILSGITKKQAAGGTLRMNFKRKLEINTVNTNSAILEIPLFLRNNIVPPLVKIINT